MIFVLRGRKVKGSRGITHPTKLQQGIVLIRVIKGVNVCEASSHKGWAGIHPPSTSSTSSTAWHLSPRQTRDILDFAARCIERLRGPQQLEPGAVGSR